jgi:hypothetical protein
MFVLAATIEEYSIGIEKIGSLAKDVRRLQVCVFLQVNGLDFDLKTFVDAEHWAEVTF